MDSRRLALERAMRKDDPHGWGEQSPRSAPAGIPLEPHFVDLLLVVR